MIGMAHAGEKALGVYHYGYFTLKGRDIQYHGPSKRVYPSDKSAIRDTAGLGISGSIYFPR